MRKLLPASQKVSFELVKIKKGACNFYSDRRLQKKQKPCGLVRVLGVRIGSQNKNGMYVVLKQ